MVGDDLQVVAANRQVCPTISEVTFGNRCRHRAGQRGGQISQATPEQSSWRVPGFPLTSSAVAGWNYLALPGWFQDKTGTTAGGELELNLVGRSNRASIYLVAFTVGAVIGVDPVLQDDRLPLT